MLSFLAPTSKSITQTIGRAKAEPIHLCIHCGQPISLYSNRTTSAADSSASFCCSGCEIAYLAISSCGLSDFHRLREIAGEVASPAAVSSTASFESFDTSEFHRLYVRSGASGLLSTTLILEGVSCGSCLWLIEKIPQVLPGVTESRLALRQSTVEITWNPNHVSLSAIADLLNRFGHCPHPAKSSTRMELFQKEVRSRLINMAAAGALTGNLMLLAVALYAGWLQNIEPQFQLLFRWISLILGVTCLAWPGRSFFISAYRALLSRRINIDVPICMALLAGGLAGTVNVILNRGDIYFDSLAALTFLLLVGRHVQFLQQRRADEAVELLFSLLPATCTVIRPDGSTASIPTDALTETDTALIQPGQLIPADGTVIEGTSTLNTALLTGESLPTEFSPGSAVFAGTLNLSSALHVRVSAVGSSTRTGRLMNLVQSGLSARTLMQLLADRVGVAFVIGVSLLAAFTLFLWWPTSPSAAIDHTIALLIVTCPCVLGIATPLTLAAVTGKLARLGILVKSAAALEVLSRTSPRRPATVLLDKTGTLTTGDLSVLNWQPADIADTSIHPVQLAAWVSRLEAHLTHPVALALKKHADVLLSAQRQPVQSTSEPLSNLVVHPTGVSASWQNAPLLLGSPEFLSAHGYAPDDTHVQASWHAAQSAGHRVAALVHQNKLLLSVILGDAIRPEAQETVFQLRQMSYQPVIVSGDHPAAVASVANTLKIDAHHAHVSPEQKLDLVRQHKSSHPQTPLLMIGDGINDAAALASADVGIAVKGGAEASLSAADIYIATPGLSPLITLTKVAKRTRRILLTNFAISLSYNLIVGTLAIAGLMHPLIAAIVMPLSSITVLSFAMFAVKRAVPSVLSNLHGNRPT